jgi:hypothetical protein
MNVWLHGFAIVATVWVAMLFGMFIVQKGTVCGPIKSLSQTYDI